MMAKHLFHMLAVGGSALVLSVAGVPSASGASAHAVPRTPTPPPLPSIAKPQPEKWPKEIATVNSLTRSASGLVTLVWTLRNTDTQPFSPGAYFNGQYSAYQGQSANGITLTDEAGKVQYSTLRLDSGRCLCTSFSQSYNPVEPNNETTMFAEYKLPEGVTAVTVGIPGYSPAKNIHIGG